MPTYDRAPASVNALIAERIACGHYPDLEEAQVTVSAWFAYAKDGGDAVKVHGHPRPAAIKVNSTKDRMEGKADASLTIHDRLWDQQLSEEEKVALIDEQLEYLVVCRAKITKQNRTAYILSDNNGRPKLKKAVPDIYLSGFSKIARRHGDASQAAIDARLVKHEFGQILFAWGDDNAPMDDVPEIRLSGHGQDDDAA